MIISHIRNLFTRKPEKEITWEVWEKVSWQVEEWKKSISFNLDCVNALTNSNHKLAWWLVEWIKLNSNNETWFRENLWKTFNLVDDWYGLEIGWSLIYDMGSKKPPKSNANIIIDKNWTIYFFSSNTDFSKVYFQIHETDNWFLHAVWIKSYSQMMMM